MQKFFRHIALFVLLITSIASPAQKRKQQPAASTAPSQPIKLTVDATHAPEKILHAQMEIPVAAGEVKLVYPEEADKGRGWISVLTPIGTALLGLGPGQSIECNFASGKTLRLGVLDIRPSSDGGLVRPSAASGSRSQGNGTAPYCSTVLANKELP